ncbi:MAG: XRE family transcriptional regulator [Thermoleophilia bacterium]|nr:XRE family transcriptional regulator [Thermoleophilia bacterium]
MITNERQYKITKSQLKKLEQALAEVRAGDVSNALTAISVQALESEIDILQSQVLEYEQLRTGSPNPVSVTSLRELPDALIRARIARGMSQRTLATALGLKEQQIQRYEAGEYLGASLRRLLEIAKVVGVDISTDEAASHRDAVPRAESGLNWDKFPVREMYRRHWFEGFQGSLDAALRASDTLVEDYVHRVIKRPALALHRKHVRAGSHLDEYALLAWESRVLHLGEAAPLRIDYTEGSLTGTWMVELVRLSRYEDGPLRAREALADLGIALVVEPHLPGTHLDGAGLLSARGPLIGLTLRHDRVDNFWFVLLHELAHVANHLRPGKLLATFDDLDSGPDDGVEREADAVAGEALLPSDTWETSLARYVRSPDSVTLFAQELGISPAIVAGRIRHEANNYVILSDLVGRGQVRKLFREVEFGA